MTTTTRQEDRFRPEGHVRLYFENVKEGMSVVVKDAENKTTYAASDAVAAAYAGDASYIPSKVAFVYGASSDVTLATVDKSMTWESVLSECEGVDGAGTVILDFSYRPTLDSTDENHQFNRVTFHCRTENIPDGYCVYRACLLGKGVNGSEYRLLAVIDLGGESGYRAKPENFELSMDWAVKF